MYIVELAFGGRRSASLRDPLIEPGWSASTRTGSCTWPARSRTSGALLIFDVDDEVALNTILADDPYYRTLGVTVVRQQQLPIVGV